MKQKVEDYKLNYKLPTPNSSLMPQLQAMRLCELTALISQTIHDAFENSTYWVIADIINHSYKVKDDWHFFTLAEKQERTDSVVARVDGIAWKAGSLKIRDFENITGQKFTNNLRVMVNVSVEFNAAYGLKLTLHAIDINYTIGTLEQQKQDVLKRLLTECSGYIKKEGERYITRNNQLPLNYVIQRIALIASPGTAGYEDFIHTLENNSPGYKFEIDHYFTPVQGAANATQLRQRLIAVYRSGKNYDAVVLIRGGGGQADFLIFDTFILGQAIAKFPIPVITGIGHHRNETIVDIMAHSPLAAPTKAAEFIIMHNRRFEDELLNFQKSVIIKSQQLISVEYQCLLTLNAVIVHRAKSTVNMHKDELFRLNRTAIDHIKSILYIKHRDMLSLTRKLVSVPQSTVVAKLNEIEHIKKNIKAFNRIHFITQHGRINHFVSVFRLMSQANILKRGFAMVKINGRVVVDPGKIRVGNELSVIMSDKEIKTIVTSKTDHHGNDFNL